MPRGRKPKPIEQHIKEGSYRPERHGQGPMLIAGRPSHGELDEPPADMPADAKEFWSVAIARLIEIGIVDLVDHSALRALAVQYARMKAAGRVIAKVGLFSTGSMGQVIEHPAVKVEREATAMFLRLSEHFGLTPVARSRLALSEVTRRSLKAELADHIGEVELRVIDGDAIDDSA